MKPSYFDENGNEFYYDSDLEDYIYHHNEFSDVDDEDEDTEMLPVLCNAYMRRKYRRKHNIKNYIEWIRKPNSEY